ncbi:DUF1667 domain-containing protein [Romboutsia sp. 1001713B170207_170306_H8]|uniref:DUF1667 domain-containing protein n=1 Tax=Romboutsia sp. 1001713B170207_170306_H8 TaxID=2787112 RepID=UPI0008205AA0|nr:DUF1667 domain-containing protein [Romboutsia sp. 1001713B170207_170306_H8]SCH05751.1 Uncharacterized protein with conserved CXXC pairs [uncultured Clostridium sp.]
MSLEEVLAKKELTCIVCPMGCKLSVECLGDDFKVEGNNCKRGEKYAKEELTNPKRVITTTVKLGNSYLHLLPVKTESSIPKNLMFEVMKELDKIKVDAPIKVGDIIIKNILNTGVNIVSAKTVEKL